ncbi:MAG: hypothetical protein NC418_02850 [Muribaculaceae bacterium]|nr:hypothetical protein [Muribaculaceae bacterium]
MTVRTKNWICLLALIGVVIFWTWFLEWMKPGTPFQAFFLALLFFTPVTALLILTIPKAINQINHTIDLPTDPGYAEEFQENEAEAQFKILDRELLYPYSSLSWKYKLISDFCFDYPEYLPQLKENANYIRWRTDVVDWAKDNVDRLESFHFSDGIYNYVYEASIQNLEIVDIMAKANLPKEVGCDVCCEVTIKKKRVPKDYFDLPGLVWEDDDFDIDNQRKASDSNSSGAPIEFICGLFCGSADGSQTSDGGDGSSFG